MLSFFMKRWAKKQGLYIYGGRAHGVIKDYTVTLFESTGGLYFCIAAAFLNEERRLQFENKLRENAEEYDIEDFSVTSKMTVVLLPSGLHAATFAENYKYFVFSELKKCGALGIKHCNSCLKPLEDDKAKLIFINNAALQVHKKCVYDFSLKKPDFQQNEPSPSFTDGIKGAVTASLIYLLICSLINLGFSFFGFFALILPFIIRLGYESFFGPSGKPKFLTIAITTASTILLTQYIADLFYVLYLYFFDTALNNVPFISLPKIVIDNYFMNNGFGFDALINVLIAVLASLVGIFLSFREMIQEQKLLQTEFDERQF